MLITQLTRVLAPESTGVRGFRYCTVDGKIDEINRIPFAILVMRQKVVHKGTPCKGKPLQSSECRHFFGRSVQVEHQYDCSPVVSVFWTWFVLDGGFVSRISFRVLEKEEHLKKMHSPHSISILAIEINQNWSRFCQTSNCSPKSISAPGLSKKLRF